MTNEAKFLLKFLPVYLSVFIHVYPWLKVTLTCKLL